MAGNFHGGQVKFDKYQPCWQALFSKRQANHCYGQVKDNFGLVTFLSYQPDWLVPEKVKIQPCIKGIHFLSLLSDIRSYSCNPVSGAVLIYDT